MAKVLVAFYSTWGHIHQMAEAVAAGARGVDGTDVTLKRFPEVIPQEKLAEMGADQAQKAFAHVPEVTPDELQNYDAILFGIPTRYGNVPQQVAAILDRTGGLWMNGSLIGKLGSVFTSTASQHGGQETTCLGFYTFMIHQGMVITGVPYAEQRLLQMDEVSGGSPYGAGTLAGGDGSRQPSEIELGIAEFQGKRVAQLAAKLAK